MWLFFLFFTHGALAVVWDENRIEGALEALLENRHEEPKEQDWVSIQAPPEAVVGVLEKLLKTKAPVKKIRILDGLSFFNTPRSSEILKDFASTDEPVVNEKALESLARVLKPDDPFFSPFLTHSNWKLRLATFSGLKGRCARAPEAGCDALKKQMALESHPIIRLKLEGSALPDPPVSALQPVSSSKDTQILKQLSGAYEWFEIEANSKTLSRFPLTLAYEQGALKGILEKGSRREKIILKLLLGKAQISFEKQASPGSKSEDSLILFEGDSMDPTQRSFVFYEWDPKSKKLKTLGILSKQTLFASPSSK